MRCLLKLGIITKEQMNLHIKFCNERDKSIGKQHALKTMKYYGEVHGFKITKKQLKALE
jgi:hypothetical protein